MPSPVKELLKVLIALCLLDELINLQLSPALKANGGFPALVGQAGVLWERPTRRRTRALAFEQEVRSHDPNPNESA